MDFDMSWKNPTEAQLAALRYVCEAFKLKDYDDLAKYAHQNVLDAVTGRALAADAEIYHGAPYKFSPYDYAEIILMADGSLWYTQAKAWAEGQTPSDPRLSEVGDVFKLAGETAKKIVEWGYQDGKWWDIDAIFPHKGKRALYFATILEAVRLVDEANTPTSAMDLISSLCNNNTGTILSSGWRTLPILLMPTFDPDKLKKMATTKAGVAMLVAEIRASFDAPFRRTLDEARAQARAQIREIYEPAVCIKPGCENLVAPVGITPREGHFKNYRGTGACQQGHNSYWCEKCKVPHSYTSKTGIAHLPHSGGDYDLAKKKETSDDPLT